MATFPPLKLLCFFFRRILGQAGEKRNVKKNTRNLRIGALPWSLEKNDSIWMMLDVTGTVACVAGVKRGRERGIWAREEARKRQPRSQGLSSSWAGR